MSEMAIIILAYLMVRLVAETIKASVVGELVDSKR